MKASLYVGCGNEWSLVQSISLRVAHCLLSNFANSLISPYITFSHLLPEVFTTVGRSSNIPIQSMSWSDVRWFQASFVWTTRTSSYFTGSTLSSVIVSVAEWLTLSTSSWEIWGLNPIFSSPTLDLWERRCVRFLPHTALRANDGLQQTGILFKLWR